MGKRAKNEYVLVGDILKKHLSPVSGHLHLWRLMPSLSIPDGLEIVKDYFGKPVYDKKGRLLPRFQSLKRIMQ